MDIAKILFDRFAAFAEESNVELDADNVANIFFQFISKNAPAPPKTKVVGRAPKSTVKRPVESMDEMESEFSKGNYLCCYMYQKGKNEDKFCGAPAVEYENKACKDLRCSTCIHKGQRTKKTDGPVAVKTPKLVTGFNIPNTNVLKPVGPASVIKVKTREDGVILGSGKDTEKMVFEPRDESYICVGKLATTDSDVKNIEPLKVIEINQLKRCYGVSYLPRPKEVQKRQESESGSDDDDDDDDEPSPVKATSPGTRATNMIRAQAISEKIKTISSVKKG